MCDSKESGSDIEVYKWAFKKWQFNEMKENIEYAAEPILQIPLVIRLAKELGRNDEVKKLQERLEQEEEKAEQKQAIKDAEKVEQKRKEKEKTLIDELLELDAENKSFEVHYRQSMKYAPVKWTTIEDLQLHPALEAKIKEGFPSEYPKRDTETQELSGGLYSYQKEVFKKIINKENVAITAPTGTGKTLSFTMPIIQRIINFTHNL